MPSHTWLRRARPDCAPKTALRFDVLEDRLVPALAFQFDYSLDSSGFFNDPARRAELEQAGRDLAAQISSTPAAIAPFGTNTWQAVFNNPSTGAETRITNLTVPQGTVVVYVGGSTLGGSEAGQGGPGGYWVSGTAAFQQSVTARPGSGAGVWGGSVSFDTRQPWYFGSDPNALPGNQVDFYSVATHELTHVLGFGTSKQWSSLIQNGKFVGQSVDALLGSAPSVSPDGGHFAQDTHSPGCSYPACLATVAAAEAGQNPVAMQPVLALNMRVGASQLDYAALQDLGWQVNGAARGAALTVTASAPTTPAAQPLTTAAPTETTPAAVTPTVPVVPPPPAVPAPPPALPPAPVQGGAQNGKLVLVSGPNDGSLQPYIESNGHLTPLGSPLFPFGNFGGPVRAVAADVNGDGIADIVAATGPGGGSRLRVLDGRTFQDLVPEFMVFEPAFTGGVFVAAGDFDHSGRDEIVVTPDMGGGPRVRVLTFADGQLQTAADFFGIADPNFRGGARAAVGDVNHDGTPDLVVAAGYGGGPRVSVLDGASVLGGGAKRNLVGDFFAFDPALRNGAYAAVADVDGDGYGDLVLGAGPGGGPEVKTVSGRTLTTAGPGVAFTQPLADFFAGDVDQRGGVRVTAKDLDGDGQAEVIAGTGQADELRVYHGTSSQNAEAFAPFGLSTSDLDGVYVG